MGRVERRLAQLGSAVGAKPGGRRPPAWRRSRARPGEGQTQGPMLLRRSSYWRQAGRDPSAPVLPALVSWGYPAVFDGWLARLRVA